MKKLIIFFMMAICSSANAADISCKEINKNIDDNVKQAAAYQALGTRYAIKTGNINYLNKTKVDIDSLKSENSMLMQQSAAMKCKIYTGDLTGKSYKKFADACVNADESDPEKKNLCDYDLWK